MQEKKKCFLCKPMALYIASLNSGSNGNCYYVGNSAEAILVDGGISCRETEKRMLQLGLSMKLVKAIFISHEHTDHIKGVSILANKYKLPVYITAVTAQQGPRMIRHLSRTFIADEPIRIGTLVITPFTKMHDAGDPHSFIISDNGITVGVFTDIGKACEQVTRYFSRCHAAFLEANYDEELLENGGYPNHLKQRIRSDRGHLSNGQALELFNVHRPAFMTHLLLSHLSRDNNDPLLVKELFTEHANGIEIVIASRYEPTGVFEIVKAGENFNRLSPPAKHPQLKLFE